MLPWLHTHQTDPRKTTMSSFDKTVASMIDRVTADAESVAPYVIEHVLETYDLTKEYDRRQARIYTQQQRILLTDKAKAAKVAAMSRASITSNALSNPPSTVTTTEATPVIEIIVGNKGETKQVINHNNARVEVKPLVPATTTMKSTKSTKAVSAPATPAFEVAPAVVTVEATTVTTELATISVSHIESEYLRKEVEAHLDDLATFGNLLSYPVFKEVGTSTNGHADYMLIKGHDALTAYAYDYYANGRATFTAIILDSANKVKQVGAELDASHYLPQYVLRGLFEKTTKAATKATKPAVVATTKAVETKPTKTAPAPAASLDVLAKQVQADYHTPMMKLKASVNAYLVAEGLGAAKLGSKATKAEVLAQAHNIITCAGLEITEAPAKATVTKTTATTKAAKTEGRIPTSDVMKKAAAAAGVDVSNVNFRSSTQRAALAVTLGLM